MKKRLMIMIFILGSMTLISVGYLIAANGEFLFERALQKKEEKRNSKQEKIIPEQAKQKSVVQTMRKNAETEADVNYKIVEKKHKKGTLDSYDDSVIARLGAARDTRSVPLLMDILKNYHVIHIRVAAAEALGVISDLKAVPVLIEMLDDKDYQIKVAVAGALVELGKADKAFPVLAKVAKKEGIETWDIDVESRLETYSGETKEKKRKKYIERFKNETLPSKAIRYLGEIRNEDALEVIEITLGDPSEFVRLESGSILMETNRKNSAIPIMDKLASDESVPRSIRSAALSALAKGKGEQERTILKRYEKSSDEYLSNKAIKLLNQMGSF